MRQQVEILHRSLEKGSQQEKVLQTENKAQGGAPTGRTEVNEVCDGTEMKSSTSDSRQIALNKRWPRRRKNTNVSTEESKRSTFHMKGSNKRV